MDSPYTWALVAMALVAMAFSYQVNHAWRWVAAGGASFFASTLFLDFGDRPDLHPFLTLGCDALVFLLVLKYWKEDWELGVAIAFLASVFCSLMKIWGLLPAPWVYPSLLELANLGALLCITTTGIVDLAGRRENSPLNSVRARFHSPRHHL